MDYIDRSAIDTIDTIDPSDRKSDKMIAYGEIWVQSKEGVGTMFCFSIPK